jgi:hypothetical protein
MEEYEAADRYGSSFPDKKTRRQKQMQRPGEKCCHRLA